MHIAAADAGLLDVHADVVRVAELGDGAVFEGDVFEGLEDEGGVLRGC